MSKPLPWWQERDYVDAHCERCGEVIENDGNLSWMLCSVCYAAMQGEEPAPQPPVHPCGHF